MRTSVSTGFVSVFMLSFFMLSLTLAGCSEMKKAAEDPAEPREISNAETPVQVPPVAPAPAVEKDRPAEGAEKSGGAPSNEAHDSVVLLRRVMFESMTNSKGRDTLHARIGAARLYVENFPFQSADQSAAQRDHFYQQGLAELFTLLDEVAPSGFETLPSADPAENSATQKTVSVFNALALTLHKKNARQAADPRYGQAMSFYDLILIALRLKPEIESGRIVLPTGPHFIKEVLSRPGRVEQLLQTRYSMFTYGLLGMTTTLADDSSVTKFLKLLMRLDVDVTEERRGLVVSQNITDEILKPAAQTAEDMASLGMRTEVSGLTRYVRDHMNVIFHSKDRLTERSEREMARESLWRRYLSPKVDSRSRRR